MTGPIGKEYFIPRLSEKSSGEGNNEWEKLKSEYLEKLAEASEDERPLLALDLRNEWKERGNEGEVMFPTDFNEPDQP